MADASVREEIYDSFADMDKPIDEKIAHALDVGTEYLDLPIGFLTRIDGDTQLIVQSTGSHDLLQPGESCPLDEAYCRRTVEIDGTLSVQHAAEATAISSAAVDTFGLGTYIGSKILVNGEVYGTVCFADRAERDARFSEVEEVFVELLAKLIGGAFQRRVYEHELQERNDRLRREKRRFEGIAEASFDIIFRIDRDRTFSYVSAAVERILGYDPGELCGSDFDSIIVPDSVDDALAAYRSLLDGDTVEALELDFRTADGGVAVLEVNARPIEDDGTGDGSGDRITGIQGVGRDVTARKEREEELRLKDRAIEEAELGISIGDAREPDLPLVYVNEGFERITGYDEAAALGRNCRFLQGEATEPDTVATIREAIAAVEPATVELINYRRDGTPFWNHLTVNPVEDADGTVTHFLGFQTDITDRVRTEQLIRLLNRVLRHNLRNDLTVVLGYGNQVMDGSLEPAVAQRKLEATVGDLMELSDKARELEAYARREREPRRLDPAAILADVAATYREAFPDATVSVDVATDRGLCAGSELSRAIEEVVENACVHAGSAAPTVEITAVDAGEEVEIEVSDDGPGIDEAEVVAITEGAETPLEHGTGLGLWLVNWIVTRYGGSFELESTDEEGTVARILVPAIGAATTVEEAARRPTVLFP